MAKGFLTGQNKAKNGYQYPSDWINIDDVGVGCINLLVGDAGIATYAFNITTDGGQYQVDWGDGTITLHDSATICEHTYTVGSGKQCSRGYTTFKITISSASNIIAFKVESHSVATQSQEHQILACVMDTPYLATLSYAFYKSSPAVYCRSLESVKIKATSVTVLNYAFTNCLGLFNIELGSMPLCTTIESFCGGVKKLCKIDISGLTGVTNASSAFNGNSSLSEININMPSLQTASSMFINCSCLQKIDISASTSITNATSMFSLCSSLSYFKCSTLYLLTNTSSMFSGCVLLTNVDISSFTNVSMAVNMFNGCYSLDSFNSSDFAKNATSVNATAFLGCEQLTSVNIQNAKLEAFWCYGSSGKLNKLQTVKFSPLSTFSGSSPQFNISYCNLTAEQLNTIFTDLPTVTGKTITITGCTGASTCTKTIATAKGWTVTG